MTKHDSVSQEGIMKATEFVKEHGIEKARECIEAANDYGGFWVNAKTLELSNLIPSYDAVSIPSIQRLVESHELVNEFFNLEALGFDKAIELAKKQIEELEDNETVEFWHRWDDDLSCTVARMKQAIADVEACQ